MVRVYVSEDDGWWLWVEHLILVCAFWNIMLLESGDPNELPYEADGDDDKEEEFLCSLEKKKIYMIFSQNITILFTLFCLKHFHQIDMTLISYVVM